MPIVEAVKDKPDEDESSTAVKAENIDDDEDDDVSVGGKEIKVAIRVEKLRLDDRSEDSPKFKVQGDAGDDTANMDQISIEMGESQEKDSVLNHMKQADLAVEEKLSEPPTATFKAEEGSLKVLDISS